jgi:shikimate kinase
MSEGGFRIDRSIALVGLMGAGKSTVGRILAGRLGIGFADSDEEIERNCGMSIVELFEQFGEAGFRERERRVLSTLVEGKPRVIATGGGAIADPISGDLLKQRCFTVWLDAPVDILAARLGDGDGRPLLGASDTQAIVQRLLVERQPAYASAQFKVDGGGSPPEAVVERILSLLAECRT